MPDHRDTDERLRYYLNNDQISRERLCIAIMAMAPRHTHVEPRRPEGGPDGARDIQGVLDDNTIIWGAVGFQNSVTDSKEEKKQIKRKFADDLDAALLVKSDLKAFAFFTNVDLTPGEQDELREAASKRGISHVDIYWRERLRLALDSPQGLGLRYQYLKMTLSDAEQASFFSTYGKQLEAMVLKQHEGIQRLEFLHRMSRPLRRLGLTATLRKPLTGDSGDVYLLAHLFCAHGHRREPWWIGGFSDYMQLKNGGQIICHMNTVFARGALRGMTPIEESHKLYETRLRALTFSVQPTGRETTPDAFEGSTVRLYMTPNLVDMIDEVAVEMNGYSVVQMEVHERFMEQLGARPGDSPADTMPSGLLVQRFGAVISLSDVPPLTRLKCPAREPDDRMYLILPD